MTVETNVQLQSGRVPISAIKIGERKRELGDTSGLAESIREIGQLQPILLQTDGTLIAGYHRLEACKSLGWTEIEASVTDLGTLEAELAEIDENLVRNELHWFDRDRQLARRKEIYEALHPDAKHGGDRKSEGAKSNRQNDDLIPAFVKDASSKVGASERTIERSIQRATTFTEKQGEILKRADVKPTEATKLARKPEPVRVAILDALATSDVKTVKAAELAVARKQIEAQTQAAPSKPCVTHASWEVWLPQQSKCDLLITDPPYSTDVEDIDAFAAHWLPTALNQVKDSGRAYICIGAYPHELRAYLNAAPVHPSHMRLLNVLVWTYKNTLGPKPKKSYNLNWQAILYFIGINAPSLDIPLESEQFSVMEINAPDGRVGDRYHTWQKPDELAERLIRHSTKPGDVVMDCFSGTGTFLLAAHRLGRTALGCEKSADMIDLARLRGCEVDYDA